MDSGMASTELPSTGFIDEAGRARLSKATRCMLGQYYEFGVSAEEISSHTQHRYKNPPGPSTVTVVEPAHSSRSLHRRESAHHHSSVTPSLTERPLLSVSTSNPRKEGPSRPQELNIRDAISPARVSYRSSANHYSYSASHPEAVYPRSGVPTSCDDSLDRGSRRKSSVTRHNAVTRSLRRDSGLARYPIHTAMNIPELQDLSRYPSASRTSYTQNVTPTQTVHNA